MGESDERRERSQYDWRDLLQKKKLEERNLEENKVNVDEDEVPANIEFLGCANG